MSNQQLKYLIVGGAALLVLWQLIKRETAKPLQSNINPQAIEPDSIARALSKLADGSVKVNDTPTETKNAAGQ
jgi:hypothetical protein